MAGEAVSDGYSSSAVCAAIDVPRTTFDAWVLRGYLHLSPGPGTGRARMLTALDAVRLATVAQLNRLGITISVAGRASRRVEAHMLAPTDDDRKWMLILAPAKGPAVDNDDAHPGSTIAGQFKNLSDVEFATNLHFSDPAAFIVVDITRITERTIAALGQSPRDASLANPSP
jgi:hypothetical protein